ncbi:hypothetical protein B0J14DRAFT_446590, partial [Halenospora varia]
RLLTIDATGHTSQLLNKCADAKINAYFQDGTLPAEDGGPGVEGSFCALEAGPWNIT